MSYLRVILWRLRDIICTSESAEHRGVQPIGCMDNEPEPSRGVPFQGLPRKTDKFRLELAQSCAPGGRYDRVSSVSSLRTSDVLQHLSTKHSRLCPECSPTATAFPDQTQPVISMTNYNHAPTVSFAFHAQL